MIYSFEKALKTAQRFAEILSPFCDRFHIAGSIRREHKEVKDIEIVCQPKKELRKNPELMFDEGSMSVCGDFIQALATITSAAIKGNPEGRYMQIKTSSRICPGIYLDLFMPAPADYYRQLVIRTGSAEYVANIIASAWVRNGWVGAGEYGLRRRQDCEEIITGSTKKWKLTNHEGEIPPVWADEQDFFAWLGIKWISPVYREFKPALNISQ